MSTGLFPTAGKDFRSCLAALIPSFITQFIRCEIASSMRLHSVAVLNDILP